MRDFRKRVVIDYCPLTSVSSVHDPCRGYAETGPKLTIPRPYSGGFERVTEPKGIGAATERSDEHGFYIAGRGRRSVELREQSKYVTSRPTTRGMNGLSSGRASGDWMGREKEGVGEEYRSSPKYTERLRRKR